MSARFIGVRLVIGFGMLMLSGRLAAVVHGQTTAPVYYFTTLAGESSVGWTDGQGSNARFNHPTGVALDSAGNAYVADTTNHVIRRITPTGEVSTVVGQAGVGGSDDGPLATARLDYPSAVAVDPVGNLFVVDWGTIRKVTKAGVVSTLAGAYRQWGHADGVGDAARFGSLAGLVADASGNLYATDEVFHTIRKITPSGVVTTLAGEPGQRGTVDGSGNAARFNSPSGIAVDSAGFIYVGEWHTIRRISPVGVVTTLAGNPNGGGESVDGVGGEARFWGAGGLTLDRVGNLYVADGGANAIRRVTAAGVVTTLAGQLHISGDADGTGNAARFYEPSGIAADESGNLIVGDRANNTIRRVSPTGVTTTLAGLSFFACSGKQDGLGRAARFNRPNGLAVSPTGDVYVADEANHTIRRISRTGAVSTFAGVAGVAGHADGSAAAATFNGPVDVAFDAAGNLYVADGGNHVIRRITPGGEVGTLAGSPGEQGSVDGFGGLARFRGPISLTVDSQGNIIVADGAHVRRVSPGGEVSTLGEFDSAPINRLLTGIAVDASSGVIYASDPKYSYIAQGGYKLSHDIRLNFGANSLAAAPFRLAAGRNGKLFMLSGDRSDYRRILGCWQADAALVDIVGGQPADTASAEADGVGRQARFNGANGIAVDADGALYISCQGYGTNTIRKGVLASAPEITTQPQSQSVAAGGSVTFSVTAAAVPEPTYQWQVNGTPIPGATAGTLSFSNARSSDAGDYTVVITNELGAVTSAKATLTVTANSGGGGNSSGGGGGGAPSLWFFLAAGAAAAMRQARRIFASAPREEF